MRWSLSCGVLGAPFVRWIAPLGVPIVLSVGSTHSYAQETASPQPPARAKRSGQLTLANTAWDSVRVEVRSGGAGDCSQNALIAVLWLKRDRVWAVKSDVPVCWRREQTPGAGSDTWTPWTRRVIAPDEKRTDPLGTTD